MSEHTQGKLICRGYSIYTADWKTPVADTCLTASLPENDHANARRLVACWNACEGIADPETVVPRLFRLNDRVPDLEASNASLRSENAALLEALKLARDHIDMGALEVSHCKDAEQIRAAILEGGAQ